MPPFEGYKLSIDTWKTGEIEEDILEESQDIEDADLEMSSWEPIEGSPCDGVSLVFVDGVRRTESLVYIEGEGGELSRGAFVSVGVGALFIKHKSLNFSRDAFLNLSVKRFFIVEEGLELRIRRLKIPFGGSFLEFEVENAQGDISPHINRRMSELEGSVALKAYRECRPDLMITDGTVHYSAKVKSLPFIGYVKKHRRFYIPSDRVGIIRELKTGQRTPIVRIHSQPTMEGDRSRSLDKFTWYVKISEREGVSGLARLEVSAGVGLSRAKELANMTAYIIPKLASAEFSDRRAPQNLTPIRHLENTLRRRLGSQALIRRILLSLFTD